MEAIPNGQNMKNVVHHAEEARNHAQGHATILHRLMVEKIAKTSELQPNQDHVMPTLAQVCLRNARSIIGSKKRPLFHVNISAMDTSNGQKDKYK